MDHWINLYRASHSLEAHALKGALEVEGVPVRLNGEALSGALGELPVDLLQVTLMVRAPGGSDDIGAVVDYDFVREGVLGLVAARHFNLQEALCGEILDLCLRQTGVLGAVVQTNKPDVYPGVAEVACRMARMGPAVSGFPWWMLEL